MLKPRKTKDSPEKKLRALGTQTFTDSKGETYQITAKQRTFCYALIETGIGTQAALKAFDVKNRELYYIPRSQLTKGQNELRDKVESVANSMATKLVRKAVIWKFIDKTLREAGFSEESVDFELFKAIKQSNDMGAKVRAIAEFNKLKNRYPAERLQIEDLRFSDLSDGEIAQNAKEIRKELKKRGVINA